MAPTMQAPNSSPSSAPVRTRLTRAEAAFPEEAADLIQPKPGSGKGAGEQIEAAAHHPSAEQGDEDAAGGTGQPGKGDGPPERGGAIAAARKPCSEPDRAAKHQTFGRAGDVAGRSAEQQVESIEAEQFHDAADDHAAQSAADHAPLAGGRKPSRSDAEAHARAADQARRDRQPQEDEQDRSRAHALPQRLRRSHETVEQPADQAREARAHRACSAEQEELPPAVTGGPAGRLRLHDRGLSVHLLHRRDEAVAMFRNGLDEARPCGVVAELPPQRLDALGERFVGDGDAAPHSSWKRSLETSLPASRTSSASASK
jgi:hypothetical protein